MSKQEIIEEVFLSEDMPDEEFIDMREINEAINKELSPKEKLDKFLEFVKGKKVSHA